MTQYTLKNTTPSHTDITRLRAGQVGGQVNILECSSIQRRFPSARSFGQSIRVVNIKEKMAR